MAACGETTKLKQITGPHTPNRGHTAKGGKTDSEGFFRWSSEVPSSTGRVCHRRALWPTPVGGMDLHPTVCRKPQRHSWLNTSLCGRISGAPFKRASSFPEPRLGPQGIPSRNAQLDGPVPNVMGLAKNHWCQVLLNVTHPYAPRLTFGDFASNLLGTPKGCQGTATPTKCLGPPRGNERTWTHLLLQLQRIFGEGYTSSLKAPARGGPAPPHTTKKAQHSATATACMARRGKTCTCTILRGPKTVTGLQWMAAPCQCSVPPLAIPPLGVHVSRPNVFAQLFVQNVNKPPRKMGQERNPGEPFTQLSVPIAAMPAGRAMLPC